MWQETRGKTNTSSEQAYQQLVDRIPWEIPGQREMGLYDRRCGKSVWKVRNASMPRYTIPKLPKTQKVKIRALPPRSEEKPPPIPNKHESDKRKRNTASIADSDDEKKPPIPKVTINMRGPCPVLASSDKTKAAELCKKQAVPKPPKPVEQKAEEKEELFPDADKV